MIAVAGKPTPQTAGPMGKQGFEAPDHFSTRRKPAAIFFQLRPEN
jgi:hypothetical protein